MSHLSHDQQDPKEHEVKIEEKRLPERRKCWCSTVLDKSNFADWIGSIKFLPSYTYFNVISLCKCAILLQATRFNGLILFQKMPSFNHGLYFRLLSTCSWWLFYSPCILKPNGLMICIIELLRVICFKHIPVGLRMLTYREKQYHITASFKTEKFYLFCMQRKPCVMNISLFTYRLCIFLC